jgi:hypothetical protein
MSTEEKYKESHLFKDEKCDGKNGNCGRLRCSRCVESSREAVGIIYHMDSVYAHRYLVFDLNCGDPCYAVNLS